MAVTYSCAELLCALGLSSKIAGIASVETEPKYLLSEYKEILEKIPVIHCADESTGAAIPIRRELEGLEPDLICANYYYRSYLDRCGETELKTPLYVMEGSIPEKATLDSVYRDIFNLGKIFDVEDRACSLAQKIRGKISHLPTRPFKVAVPRVFVYDRGKKSPITSFADTLENSLITLAGGENVFGNRRGAYRPVTWTEVADSSPDCILVHSYPGYMSAKEKIEWLKSVPEISTCPAIKENQFLVLTLSEIFPGIQNAAAAEKMCAMFDPDAI